MAESIAHSLLRAETQNHRLNLEQKFEPQHAEQLKLEFRKAIQRGTQRVPATLPWQEVRNEGPIGHLPTPAKRLVVSDLIQDRTPTPLRVTHELEQTAPPERPMDRLAIHLITEVTPNSIALQAEQRTFLVLMQYLKELAGTGNILFEPIEEGDPGVRFRDISIIHHNIQRGSLGNFGFESLELGSPSTVQRSVSAYEASLNQVIGNETVDKVNTDYVAHHVIDGKIVAALKADQGPYNLVLPILINPRTYPYFDGHYGNSFNMLGNLKHLGVPVLVSDLRNFFQAREYNDKSNNFEVLQK